jgi:hypothetical protein
LDRPGPLLDAAYLTTMEQSFSSATKAHIAASMQANTARQLRPSGEIQQKHYLIALLQSVLFFPNE